MTTSDSATYSPSQQDKPEGDFYFDDNPADINNTIINDTNSDDCFFFDGTPADISFPHATIIINGNGNGTKNQDSTMSTTPDIQSLSIESKRAKKKRKQHRNKVQKAKKIIPGDDICIEISSDEEDLTPLTSYNNPMNAIEINSNDDDDDDDDDDVVDMTYTFQEESALDQDFIENTDPDSWQQLQQWATKRSVDDQQYGRLDDFDSDDLGDDSTIQPDLLSNEGRGAISDFGLDDSEDDEFIQKYIAHQQHQHHKAQHLQNTIQNTLPDLPPSLHAGIHGFLQHNRRYTSRKKKASAGTLSNHTNIKDRDTYSGQLRRLDRRIQLFVSDTSRQTYQLPKMTLYCRQLVQGLVKLYHLKVSSDNSNEQKIGLSLEKCPATQLPKNRQMMEKYIDKARIPERTKRRMERRSGTTMKIKSSPSSRKHQGQRRQRHSDGGGGDGSRPGNATTARAAHGTVVGLAAAPLASNNVGHKMLAKMGWKEGDALGTNKDGIADPIQAVIRDRRRGLGA
ncbi:unnamed protein product [Absidia cylindrospora]